MVIIFADNTRMTTVEVYISHRYGRHRCIFLTLSQLMGNSETMANTEKLSQVPLGLFVWK